MVVVPFEQKVFADPHIFGRPLLGEMRYATPNMFITSRLGITLFRNTLSPRSFISYYHVLEEA
jgi:hypothetical protein